MIGSHFLDEEDRAKLIALARDGLAASRVTRRANALVLLDDGWSCRDVAAASVPTMTPFATGANSSSNAGLKA